MQLSVSMCVIGSLICNQNGKLHVILTILFLQCTTCKDYKQLGPAVYHSTGFLQSHKSHKRFLKMPRNIRCPFPGIVSNWQSHNSHRRVLKMPLVVVVVVSISQNSTYWLLRSQDGHKRLLKVPRRLLKMPRNISWIASITCSDRSNLAVEINFLEFL